MTLDRIEVNNFQKLRQESWDFTSNKGVNLVMGMNGSGKSSLFFEAPIYLLYGQTARWGANCAPSVTTLGSNKHLVRGSITSGDAYEVLRARNWEGHETGLTITSGGKDISLGKTLHTQEALDRIIGFDLMTWRNGCMFDAEFGTFSKLSADKQRSIIDQVLGITKLESALEDAKARLNRLNALMKELDIEYSLTMEQRNRQEERLADLIETETGYDQSEAERIKTVKESNRKMLERKKKIEASIEEIEKLIGEAKVEQEKVRKERSEVETGIAVLRQNLRTAEAQLDELEEEEKSGVCQSCKRPLEGRKHTNCADRIKSKTREIAEIKHRLASERERLGDIPDWSGEIKNGEDFLMEKKESLASISFEDETPRPNPHSSQIDREKKELERLKEKVEQLKEQIETTSKSKEDEEKLVLLFGNKGCRLDIMETARPFLIGASREIAELMQTNMSVSFDLGNNGSFKLNVSVPGGSDSYKGISSGERRVADVITMFCLLRLSSSRSGGGFGQFFFDEVFEHLDGKGLRGVSAVLRTLDNVYVLAHNPAVAAELSPDRVIKMQNGSIISVE